MQVIAYQRNMKNGIRIISDISQKSHSTSITDYNFKITHTHNDLKRTQLAQQAMHDHSYLVVWKLDDFLKYHFGWTTEILGTVWGTFLVMYKTVY